MLNVMVSQVMQRTPHSAAASGTSQAVAHNLGYKPAIIQIVDGSGVVHSAAEFEVKHDSVNQFTVSFGESVSGYTIYYK